MRQADLADDGIEAAVAEEPLEPRIDADADDAEGAVAARFGERAERLLGLGERAAIERRVRPAASRRQRAQRTPDHYLNSAAFTPPAAGTYSDLKPNAFYGPSRLQNDLAVTRVSRIPAQQLQFRWEIFNVTNKANFNNPTTALDSSNFGRILSAGDPRIMQFALKFDF